MEITQEEYNRISKIEDNDDAFEETLKLLEPYLEKYKEFHETNNYESIDKETFKKETKIIFGLLHYVFSTVDIDESDEEDDKEKFDTLTKHTRYVYTKIDDINFDDLSPEFSESLSYIVNYFEESNKNMKAINESLSSTCDILEDFSIDMENSVKLNKIIEKMKEESVSKDEILEGKTWCQSILKDRFKKEDVLEVIEEFHKGEKINYKTLYESTEDKELQKKYLSKMKINNYISTILNLEVFMKNKFSS